MGLVVVVVGYSTISIVYGVGVKPLFLLMCGSLVCPPTPAATCYLWFCCGIRLIRSKLKGQNHTEVDNEQASLLLPSIPLDTRVMIEREARRLAGYYQGRQISDHFLTFT